ncbi:LPXTG cell wall anchor domain-containing protein [Marinococcus halophilus]|uniref:LPXTG cell wall anchor domain-containing protein n=1 Tax=Marinococcus halophilus TaxID=1371 RepID=UPI0009A7A92D|nr:LPXTG cell wall anchor domain-containing protein [Marinococcus halophilus]
MSKKWLVSLFSAGVISLGISAPASADDENCSDFSDGQEVLAFWEDNNYGPGDDPHNLDADNDNLPCEGLTEGMESEFDAAAEGSEENETTEDGSSADTTEDTTSTTEEETSSSDEGTTEETTNEEEAASTEASDENMTEESAEEGGEMPETATNQPAWALAGTAVAGLGALLLVRRRITSH